ncbi:MAG: radical SAM protein [Candidatus Omnitrophica bacterium]|nr:radical SAM protein [Candidatus Omnitrophota bacterium]
MEFTDLGRYTKINEGKIPPFQELLKMKPVHLTQELQMVQEEANLRYVEELSKKGIRVVPIRRILPERNFKDRLTFPRRILFEMTSHCNVLCHMCPRQELKRASMDIDKALYKKVLDEIDQYGIEYLATYHLGESLLHPDFRELVDYISTKRNLGYIWMSTNGHKFDAEAIRYVLGSCIDYVNFSAHAITEETYKKVVPRGDFKTVQDNLKLFYKMKGKNGILSKPFLHCQMIEQEATQYEVDGFIQAHFDKAEIVSVNMLEYVHFTSNAFGAKQRLRKELKNCIRISRNDCFICSDGSVVPCDAAYNGEICLGNIQKRTLYDIWNSDERRKLLELNEQGRMAEIEICRHCTDYDI